MVALTGYQINELIYSGSKTLVHRGIRESDKKPVVIKLLRREYPTFYELVRFRNQYTIAKNLDIDGIIKTYSLENYQNSYALVMEDLGGISLQEEITRWGDRGMGGTADGLQAFFHIALQIVSILDGLYHNRVIHKDIKPANILINPTTKDIRLIDFSIASLLSRETQTLTNPNILEGTLAYLSPEQTGRMNRGIDYRSDFYSLGVTLFELLTGQLPFNTDEPMELVYCHLAKLPPQVHSVNPEIPPILSEIIGKLMAKNAEDRYQSALGLKYDLEICWRQWQETGSMDVFELGVRDICDRFIIPEKLYGRQAEVESLLAAFDRVANPPESPLTKEGLRGVEMILVAGFSGIGKTAVINEVHKPIVQQRGYFIKGKYDQFQRNIPLRAFVQAFRDLMGQLLSETDAQLEQWKATILTALGENAQVIIEVIPELEKIIGEQPPVPELSGTAGQNRFNLLFQKFIQVFTTKEHPLVIFLDDLQWADSASLKLMQFLMSETAIHYMLVIGAYRDNEVYPAHPLISTLGEIHKNRELFNTITLAPLTHTDLSYLIADALKCNLKIAQPLTDLVYQKTQGNPLFANQFLKLLHEEELINYNFDMGHWQCDIAQVRALAFTDDLVEFMVLQLQKLPKATQKVLQLAACIDNQFDLATLAIVHEKSLAETAADLWKALQEGLIIPTTEVYKFYQQEPGESVIASDSWMLDSGSCSYKFLHDRVQQAAYSLISEDQKQTVHLKIGRLMLRNISPEQREEHLFKLVNQLNLGVELISQPEEQEELAKLNLTASHKARISTAYEAAVEYANFGIRLLTEDCWQHQYELALTLYSTSADAAHLNGDFEQMEQSVKVILENGKTLIDQVKAYEVRILSHIAQNRMLEAIKMGLQVLKLLGIELPEQPTPADIPRGLQETQLALEGKPIEGLLELKLMTEPDKLAAMNILTNIAAPAYLVIPELYPLILFKQVHLSLKYGNTANSLYGYSCYGLILCAFVGDVESGYKFGQLTLKLLDKLNAKESIAKTYTCIYGSLNSWKNHIREIFNPLQLAYSSGLEIGDLEFAGYCAWIYSFNSYLAGKELSSLAQEIANYSQGLAQIRQEPSLHKNELFRQIVLNLLSKNQNPCSLIGEAYNEETMLPLHQQGNDQTIICFLHFHKLVLCYLFAEYTRAIENAELAQNYLESVIGSITVPLFHFYDSLSQLAVYPDASEDKQAFILKRVTANQEKMHNWAHHAPMNHLHKFHLVEAERDRILGEYIQAMEMYDRAIQGAKENEYIQEEALAHELAAKFYLGWGKEQIAQTYLTNAYYCYVRWGAKAKVYDLEKRYPQLLAPILQWEKIRFNPTETASSFNNISLSTFTAGMTISSSSTSISDALDLASVLKASQALSSEIHLEKLLSTLMQVVMENTGAKKCALILLKDNVWVIEAIATFQKVPTILQSIPIEFSQDIPLTLINYVKRTLETLVVDDATVKNSFTSDSYIIQQQPKSLLCTPILHQGKLMGILYLENNLIAGVFTRDRLQVINLLCSQAAISLENASLYQRSQENAQQLKHSLTDLQQMQLQLVQSEKMSALGNLVAGVAHEINNPVGFIAGNIQPAVNFVEDLFRLIDLYQQKFPNPGVEIEEEIAKIDLEYIREDLPKMISSMKLGTDRIRSISNSLRTFSRADTEHKVAFNIHEGIDSAILILKHRLKASELHPDIKVVKQYGDISLVKCFPGQLNQVFMNLLANAIDALEESNIGHNFHNINNKIEIKTCLSEDKHHVLIYIRDNGMGMSDDVKQKIFDHLFTTKSVGKGTGLGLAIARQIIVEKHGGTLEVNSAQGEGTEFVIQIPI
ncbi:MAG: trifunctional serine/threonine-protein kinase/ATP-binding protein/sensor histidine kinase [Nostoc sp. ChiQUE02]|uniref:trifunctional serine/threonine-protein kinase/ATP-binding protein/sensor histidine kinase n=1 Tax=Nostoc sp. ChiQUE02 TaxID=3075377 RepID=UPI002AD2710D|nr:AAA family ATPase [Nostoc sp. ChiQUE02]MDZ8229953.1 AAA family ATPase [Nostoc sp. ChiQUE02]